MLIGVISDTHGLLRAEAVNALRGAQLIIHAGDIGRPEILDELRAVAPVVAVRGNVDHGPWATVLPLSEYVEVEGCGIYVLHELAQLDLNPAAAGFSAVIFGHSHQPAIEDRHGVLFLNPGSAGPRRFTLPITVAHLTVVEGRLDAAIVELPVSARERSRRAD